VQTLKPTRFAPLAVALTIMAALGMISSAASPTFYPDDPIWVEHDTEDAAGMQPLEVNLLADLAYNMLTVRTPASTRARNVNTVDEVPDSSWFTNRLGHRPLSAAEIAVGPNTTNGPAPGTWEVIASKSDGVTPGFTIKDSTGQVWFVKFDPRGYRGMATGTEVAVTKLMWALGYHVPENHIAALRREQLVIGDGAKFTPPNGNRRPMRLDDIDRLLKAADRGPDGAYRIVASKRLPGKPIGRIRFTGTRPDDPNDIVPHEDRRELRGYGVFAAWLNHVDSKALNSLDMLVGENGRSFVRHYLIDFGSALGSGAVAPADYAAGAEYYIEPRSAAKRMVAFGFAFPSWHTARYYEARSIGRLPLEHGDFNPDSWKPRVPNQAFQSARHDDKFWAARKLAAMSTDLIGAAVRAGEFNDHESELFLVRALAERRDAILRAYLPLTNPIVDPTIDESGTLTFRNAVVDADVAHAPQGYHATWSTFDNTTRETRTIGETSSSTTSLAAPAPLASIQSPFIKVDIRCVGARYAAGDTPVAAYFERRDGRWRLVGLERLSADSHESNGASAKPKRGRRSTN
jgi:hypothetical protein